MRKPVLAAPIVALLAGVALVAGCPADEKAPVECDSGLTLCGGTCVDTQTDASACGLACTRCPTGGDCVDGACECPAGLTECSGACVDLLSDELHCGSCLEWCGLGTCTGGGCVCDPGADPCTGPGAQCVDLDTRTSDCGECRLACDARESCVTGTCTCVAPNLECGTECVPAATDEANCGACDNACPIGATCTASSCVCPGTTEACGPAPGACVDLATDEAHCGDCTTSCPVGGNCSGGVCSCPASSAAVCGTGSGTCCEGTGCCGDACKTKHSNGLGGFYYDCSAVGSPLTLQDAHLAADAWSAGADVNMGFTACETGCYGRSNTAGTQCAIWCYDASAGSAAGHVKLDTLCICPNDLNPAWN